MLTRISRTDMAKRLAKDIAPGSYVNIGIGMPELVANYLNPNDEIILHSENGILGMGPAAPEGQEDTELINAGKKPVTLLAGGAFFDHVDSFTIMRGMQVAQNGDLANWNLGRPGEPPAVGGAMDLAVGAKKVYILMEHTTKDGQPKILKNCSLPLTGIGVVSRIYTDLAVMEVTPKGLKVIEMNDGLTLDQLQSVTEAQLYQD